MKKQLLTVINGNSPPHTGFLKGKSLTVIISRPWVCICKAEIYINTTQVELLSCGGSFNLKIMSWQNSLTIPWHDITKFPDNSLTWVKCPKFPDIFSKFPDFSLTWRKFCFPLTFLWHVATLKIHTVPCCESKNSSHIAEPDPCWNINEHFKEHFPQINMLHHASLDVPPHVEWQLGN